ncbi:helix-turn-helix domain-containing protein [Agrobacterium fabrum]|uniref:helix-turn-helix domain-containing protein n=1 Tax=Agrobacterium fabrum TaxID=1176649 RepID=UPI00374D343E
MPKRPRPTMRQLRHLLRLRADGVSVRDIADMLCIARSTVQDGISRAASSGLSWPLSADLTDDVPGRPTVFMPGQQVRTATAC